MFEFRTPDITDRDRATAALRASGYMGCEYSFANNLAWHRLADSRIAFYKDFYIICAFDTEDDIPAFTMPAGEGDIRELFNELSRFTRSLCVPLRLRGVTAGQLDMLRELYPDGFTEEYDRDSSDYIYNVSDLAELAGRKYHAKRNHLARFREYEYSYSPVTEADFDDCIVFCTEDYNSRGDEAGLVSEQFAINTFFNHFRELGLSGGIIRINGKTAAVTVGEPLNSETFCVHIEKGDTEFAGIYAGINNCFVRDVMPQYRYVNREEDMGLDGLRRAKLSYRPAFLLDKYTVTFRQEIL